MKILTLVLIAGLLISLTLTAEKTVQEVIVEDGKKHQLTVQVNEVNSEYKSVVFYIYDEAEQRVFRKTLSPSEAKQPVVFEGIETGRYAVYIHQNKDDDPELKSTNNGIPLEPLGFANNPILQGPPQFSSISISITQDTEVSINLVTYG